MKQKQKLLILALVLVLLLGAGVWFLSGGDGQADAGDAVWLQTQGAQAVTELAIRSNTDGQTLRFTRGNDAWTGEDGSSYDLDSFAAFTAVFGYLKAERKLESTAQQQAEYGLDSPVYTVSATYSDGTGCSYSLGKYAPSSGYYIASPDEPNTVYVLDSTRSDSLKTMVTTLFDVSLDVIDFSEVRGLLLRTEDGADYSLNRSEAPRADATFYWKAFKPVAWNANTEKVEEMIALVQSIGVLKRTPAGTTAAQCGLDGEDDALPHISLYDTYDSELTLYLGEQSGQYVYCRTNYLDGVYLVDREILQLLQTTPDELVDNTLYYYEKSSITACTVDAPDGSHTLSAQWVTEDDGDRGQRYALDGSAISGGDYSALTEWFESTQVTDVQADAGENGDVYAVITIERLSAPYEQTLTLRSIPGDAAHLQVDLGQPTTARIEKAAFDAFAARLAQQATQ